jgi:molybdopterin converting factor small subunit
MSIQILFFGATADITGQRRIDLESPAGTASADVFDKLLGDYPRLAAHKLHYSVNQCYAKGDEVLNDGDEMAVFTAVSGG